jgi:hypothetical protein
VYYMEVVYLYLKYAKSLPLNTGQPHVPGVFVADFPVITAWFVPRYWGVGSLFFQDHTLRPSLQFFRQDPRLLRELLKQNRCDLGILGYLVGEVAAASLE